MARLSNHEMQRRLQARGLGHLLETSGPFRKFVFALFVDAGIFFPTYREGSPHGTSYWEGRRSLGLEVLHLLKAIRPDILSIIETEGNLVATEAAPPPGDNDAEPSDDHDDHLP